MRDRTRTSMGCKKSSHKLGGGLFLVIIINGEGKDDGGQRHTGIILKPRGTQWQCRGMGNVDALIPY